MRVAFAGSSGTGKSTLARWLVSPEGPLAGLPICSVGSRSVAKEMGFVDPETGEGRPYDVDRADGAAYQAHLDIGWFTVDQVASMAMAGWQQGVPTVRSPFQQRLADAKIAWERGASAQGGFVSTGFQGDSCRTEPRRLRLRDPPLPGGGHARIQPDLPVPGGRRAVARRRRGTGPGPGLPQPLRGGAERPARWAAPALEGARHHAVDAGAGGKEGSHRSGTVMPRVVEHARPPSAP